MPALSMWFWVCLSLRIARVLYLGPVGSAGEGRAAFLLCQDRLSRCFCGFWCCWEEGCWDTTVWGKKLKEVWLLVQVFLQ